MRFLFGEIMKYLILILLPVFCFAGEVWVSGEGDQVVLNYFSGLWASEISNGEDTFLINARYVTGWFSSGEQAYSDFILEDFANIPDGFTLSTIPGDQFFMNDFGEALTSESTSQAAKDFYDDLDKSVLRALGDGSVNLVPDLSFLRTVNIYDILNVPDLVSSFITKYCIIIAAVCSIIIFLLLIDHFLLVRRVK